MHSLRRRVIRDLAKTLVERDVSRVSLKLPDQYDLRMAMSMIQAVLFGNRKRMLHCTPSGRVFRSDIEHLTKRAKKMNVSRTFSHDAIISAVTDFPCNFGVPPAG